MRISAISRLRPFPVGLRFQNAEQPLSSWPIAPVSSSYGTHTRRLGVRVSHSYVPFENPGSKQPLVCYLVKLNSSGLRRQADCARPFSSTQRILSLGLAFETNSAPTKWPT